MEEKNSANCMQKVIRTITKHKLTTTTTTTEQINVQVPLE